MPPTPLRSSGAAQTLRLGTDMTASSPFELSAPRHPACLLFTITSEQDNGGTRQAPLQNLSLIYGCFARHQGLVEPARSLPQGKTNRKAGATPRFGGARRDRTDDLKLAKLALSQLSYGPDLGWWAREDLNLRPHAYQACALTN